MTDYTLRGTDQPVERMLLGRRLAVASWSDADSSLEALWEHRPPPSIRTPGCLRNGSTAVVAYADVTRLGLSPAEQCSRYWPLRLGIRPPPFFIMLSLASLSKSDQLQCRIDFSIGVGALTVTVRRIAGPGALSERRSADFSDPQISLDNPSGLGVASLLELVLQ